MEKWEEEQAGSDEDGKCFLKESLSSYLRSTNDLVLARAIGTIITVI
eukprot:CAMPEP_0185264714 /NCGR_PEP_ID=MMETSP1359-20130426/24462_1 /TAXON_ID=552665 /ORGANISM="Bigelowiella longifila, Strain CCMP242" /LENGTH=46 /DNA_ID= /DNA_START= /DNA_END= /DNA_ORIENTATION=